MSRDPRYDAAMRSSQGHERGWDFRPEETSGIDLLASAIRMLPGFALFAVVAIACFILWGV